MGKAGRTLPLVGPMTRLSNPAKVTGQIAALNAGGGTNIYSGMAAAHQPLLKVSAKIKHMILLSDGQSSGANFQALAAQMKTQGITISTIAVGNGADTALLQSIAQAGGGQFYFTNDPTSIPKIFTQDTMKHTGKLIREENFVPRQAEEHPMIKGWSSQGVPPLMGYVKTHRKVTAQIPLVTDLDDPLLAHWRFGLGKVTAFTSDCKSRWSALWLTNWSDGYSRFWSQVLREMARPPQGRFMDIHIDRAADGARILVDVMEGPAAFKDNAKVDAEIYFVPATSLGSGLKLQKKVRLKQSGPGRYVSDFQPSQSGVYLVRARHGAQMVSASIVRNPSSETATGRADLNLLQRTTALTGGAVIDDGQIPSLDQPAPPRFVELTGPIVVLILLIFVADLILRRWENVQGLMEFLSGLGRRRPTA